jgi:hypothetical protein
LGSKSAPNIGIILRYLGKCLHNVDIWSCFDLDNIKNDIWACMLSVKVVCIYMYRAINVLYTYCVARKPYFEGARNACTLSMYSGVSCVYSQDTSQYNIHHNIQQDTFGVFYMEVRIGRAQEVVHSLSLGQFRGHSPCFEI